MYMTKNHFPVDVKILLKNYLKTMQTQKLHYIYFTVDGFMFFDFEESIPREKLVKEILPKLNKNQLTIIHNTVLGLMISQAANKKLLSYRCRFLQISPTESATMTLPFLKFPAGMAAMGIPGWFDKIDKIDKVELYGVKSFYDTHRYRTEPKESSTKIDKLFLYQNDIDESFDDCLLNEVTRENEGNIAFTPDLTPMKVDNWIEKLYTDLPNLYYLVNNIFSSAKRLICGKKTSYFYSKSCFIWKFVYNLV